MQQVVGEMKNLSIAQPSGRAEVTSAGISAYDISSIPTTAGTGLSVFDSRLSSTMHSDQGRQGIVPPVSVPPAQLSSAIPSQLLSSSIGTLSSSIVPPVPQVTMASGQLSGLFEVDHYRQLGAMPRGLVSRVPNLSGWGANMQTNVGTTCPAIRTLDVPLIHSSLPISSTIAGASALAHTMQQQHQSGLPTIGGAPGVQTSFPTSIPGLATSRGVMNSGLFPQQPGPSSAVNTGLNPGLMFGAPGLPQLYDPVGQLQVVPTQHQLMARQVMPKDLPPFRGDPEDWPLFYSAYVNTTTACGYSDVENLARLQKALTGRAFDAVRSRLLLPACVP